MTHQLQEIKLLVQPSHDYMHCERVESDVIQNYCVHRNEMNE